MRTGLGVQALVCNAKAFDRSASDKMFADNLGGVFQAHVAVPDGIWVDHDRGTVLALIETPGLVYPDATSEAGCPGEILQFSVQFAFAVSSAAGARRAFRADVVTDEDMAFKNGQEENPPLARVSCRGGAQCDPGGFHISADQGLPGLRE